MYLETGFTTLDYIFFLYLEFCLGHPEDGGLDLAAGLKTDRGIAQDPVDRLPRGIAQEPVDRLSLDPASSNDGLINHQEREDQQRKYLSSKLFNNSAELVSFQVLKKT